MKQKLLILSAMCGLSIGVAMAQTNPVPNGNFESWTTSSYDFPQNFVGNSNGRAFADNVPFNEVKTTDKYHGTYAIKLTTVIAPNSNGGNGNDTIQGYFINTNPNKGGGPSTWHNGFPYSHKPTGMRGYYKSAIPSPDSGLIAAFFYKSDSLIGQYALPVYGTHSTYTLFTLSFTPALSQTPDSMIMLAVSSDFRDNSINRNGSMLQVDSISFIGAAGPTQFDGDFETWQTTTIKTPDSWVLQNGKMNRNGDFTPGLSRTTDAAIGNYAIELTTSLDSSDNGGTTHAVARAGAISTGWYPNSCGGGCQEQGGHPYTKKTDTLAFYYKYAPMGGDSAQVSLNFKKNGVNINGTGISLHASVNYQYKEIPFNFGGVAPDTVIVDIQSSAWNDTLLSFIGSDLKIDNIHFKSQNVSHIQSPKICPGSSLTVGTHTYTVSGTSINKLVTYQGYDSTVTTHLTVLPVNTYTQSPNACSVTVGTHTYSVSGTYTTTLTAISSGCDSIVTTYLTVPTTCATTGISNNSIEADVKLYPNPVSTIATIEIGASTNINGAELIICDVFGKTVKRISITTYTTTFDRSDLTSGIYFYKLSSGDGVLKTGKLLVE